MTRFVLVMVAVAACGDDGNTPKDAAVDASPFDAACSGGQVFFTGELVDFDSSDTGMFCGIFRATLTVHGDPTRTDSTNPNGRYQLCLAPAATTQIDVTPPAGSSECTIPLSTYNVPGMLIANQAVLATGQVNSARSFTVARAPDFNYDNTKAQVLVHVDGTQSAVSISGTGDPAQAWSGTAWAVGATGVNVFFPNVDPTPGTTTVSMGSAIGTGSVPIAAGTFTYLTVVGS